MSADPARLDLLEVLRVEGPLTSIELGRRIPAARGGLQLHLKKLAEGEWIEQLDGEGRHTRWAARPGAIEWSESDTRDPDVALAVEDLYWLTLQRRINRLRLWDNERQTDRWPAEWVESSIGRDYSFWLTAKDLDDLDSELAAVFERYRERSTRLQTASKTESVNGAPEPQITFLTVSGFPLSMER